MVAPIKEKRLERTKSDENDSSTNKLAEKKSAKNESFWDKNNFRGFATDILTALLKIFILIYFGANFIYACRHADNNNFIASNPNKPPYTNVNSEGSAQMKGGFKGGYTHGWDIYAHSKNNFVDWFKTLWKDSDSSLSGFLQAILGSWNKYVLGSQTPSTSDTLNLWITWLLGLVTVIISIPLTVILLLVSIIVGFFYAVAGGWNNACGWFNKILGLFFMLNIGAVPIISYQFLWVLWMFWFKGFFTEPPIFIELFKKYKHTISVVMLISILISATVHLSGWVKIGALVGTVISAINWYRAQYSSKE